MDWVGTAMGLATIPMALLSIASVGGGIWLVATGAGMLVATSLLVLGGGLLIAPLLERLVALLDDAAIATRSKYGRLAGMILALLCGGLPMIVILVWEYAVFCQFMAAQEHASGWALWLWYYGVATGPWTIFALKVGSDRRTLCGIRTYAGHLAYWLLSLIVISLMLPLSIGLGSMVLPAILPLVVGMLLAGADRNALKNVRI